MCNISTMKSLGSPGKAQVTGPTVMNHLLPLRHVRWVAGGRVTTESEDLVLERASSTHQLKLK